MQELLQSGIEGIALGSIIALAAVGLSLTYGILRLANFAHGDILTLGAY
jgi:neutral amino acid transport system permease protein